MQNIPGPDLMYWVICDQNRKGGDGQARFLASGIIAGFVAPVAASLLEEVSHYFSTHISYTTIFWCGYFLGGLFTYVFVDCRRASIFAYYKQKRLDTGCRSRFLWSLYVLSAVIFITAASSSSFVFGLATLAVFLFVPTDRLLHTST